MNSVTRERICLEWGRRTFAEYRSAARAQQLALWLTQFGASPDLIFRGLETAADELVHARLSYDVLIAAGGGPLPVFDRRALAIDGPKDDALEAVIVQETIDDYCFGETVAVPLFRHLRGTCDEPVARKALDQIVHDEARHSAFGWLVLDWFLASPLAESVRASAARQVPIAVDRLTQAYGDQIVAADPWTHDAKARSWGLAPPSDYEPILKRALQRVLSSLEGRGIDTSSTYNLREHLGVDDLAKLDV